MIYKSTSDARTYEVFEKTITDGKKKTIVRYMRCLDCIAKSNEPFILEDGHLESLLKFKLMVECQ